ncbi:MAG: hypothetical protein DME14_16690 [Candidatus Rokuibacteriota bacterium]|nr:MAG: hypothetical protein DME14_16690 [Candidatus Rokubacteria bacterium]
MSSDAREGSTGPTGVPSIESGDRVPIGLRVQGRYRIVRELGTGAFGSVCLAEDESTGHRVAIRLLPRWLAAPPHAAEAVLRRGRSIIAASAAHLGLVRVQEFGELEPGRIFAAMEFVEGRRLSETLSGDAPLDLSAAIRLALDLGGSVETLHNMGLVHGALRPCNVMVLEDGRVKLMDLELAGLRDARPTDGSLVAKPSAEYLSPEQICRAPVTEKTDIYSFAVILYEMLCGVPPFQAETRDAVLEKHLTEPPPPMRPRRAVPASVESIVTQALDKQPGLRPLMQDVLNGLWSDAHRPTNRRTRTVAIVGGAALAASLVVVVAWSLLALRPSGPRPLAQPAAPPPTSAQAPGSSPPTSSARAAAPPPATTVAPAKPAVALSPAAKATPPSAPLAAAPAPPAVAPSPAAKATPPSAPLAAAPAAPAVAPSPAAKATPPSAPLAAAPAAPAVAPSPAAKATPPSAPPPAVAAAPPAVAPSPAAKATPPSAPLPAVAPAKPAVALSPAAKATPPSAPLAAAPAPPAVAPSPAAKATPPSAPPPAPPPPATARADGVQSVTALAADAQSRRKTYRVGWLDSDQISAPYQDVVRQAVIGYPQDIAFEYRSADGRADRLRELAAELVRLKVDIVFAVGNQAIHAAKQATSTIPIVMLGADAVATGAVARLEEPSGNVTGVTYSSAELANSWLKLLKELRPTLSRVAVLYNADPTGRVELANLQRAAATASTKIQPYAIQEGDAVRSLFAGPPAERAEAVIVPGGPATLIHLRQIVDLASRARVPTIYGYSEFVDAGGLLAYGPSLPAMYRRAGAYIGKILNSPNPSELPVEQPSRFELVINLKAARALGLTLPESLILRADRVLR